MSQSTGKSTSSAAQFTAQLAHDYAMALLAIDNATVENQRLTARVAELEAATAPQPRVEPPSLVDHTNERRFGS